VENPHTQLVRFYGMHRVKMYHLRRKVHFVIMGSVFDTTEMIHTIYDLKVILRFHVTLYGFTLRFVMEDTNHSRTHRVRVSGDP
jgi:hypothetical protein